MIIHQRLFALTNAAVSFIFCANDLCHRLPLNIICHRSRDVVPPSCSNTPFTCFETASRIVETRVVFRRELSMRKNRNAAAAMVASAVVTAHHPEGSCGTRQV
jgi:hypothetical protein